MPSRPAEVGPELAAWLAERVGRPGPFTLRRLPGGNSNETFRLSEPGGRRWVLRRPPAEAIAPSAHSMQREHRVLCALDGRPVPAPRPVSYCADTAVTPVPVLLMEWVDGTPLTDTWPAGWRPDLAGVGAAAVDALAALHTLDWSAAGLDGFGSPDGYLVRQVSRWRSQYDRYRRRPLAWFNPVADWLEANRPESTAPALLHGDYHLDNTLLVPTPAGVRVNAIIDWEMSTIGDPLVDLGLLLAFWGPDRPARPAMPKVQGISRGSGAPTRAELAERYARVSGRCVEHLDWYMALAFFKLAAIVEGAYTQYLDGALDSAYARSLEVEVPALLAEAAGFAGL